MDPAPTTVVAWLLDSGLLASFEQFAAGQMGLTRRMTCRPARFSGASSSRQAGRFATGCIRVPNTAGSRRVPQPAFSNDPRAKADRGWWARVARARLSFRDGECALGQSAQNLLRAAAPRRAVGRHGCAQPRTSRAGSSTSRRHSSARFSQPRPATWARRPSRDASSQCCARITEMPTGGSPMRPPRSCPNREGRTGALADRAARRNVATTNGNPQSDARPMNSDRQPRRHRAAAVVLPLHVTRPPNPSCGVICCYDGPHTSALLAAMPDSSRLRQRLANMLF